MGTSQAVLAQLWLYAFLLGVGLGAVYDTVRITRVFLGVSYTKRASARLEGIRLPLLPVRKKRRTPRPLLSCIVFIEDFLFCLLSGVAIILLFYFFNNGKLRLPALLCVTVGFFLYHTTLGRIVMLFSEVIAFVLSSAVRYVLYFICLPFRWIGGKLYTWIKAVVDRIKRRAQARARLRETRRAMMNLKKDACGLLPQRNDKDTEVYKGGARGANEKAKKAV